jgi:general secretion pathway protein N
MKPAAIGIIACALLVLAIAAFAPASLLDRRIATATGGKVRLVDASGTVWNGRGALASEAGTWRSPIAWTVAWTALAQGTLAVAFEPAAGTTAPRGTLDAATNGFSLHDVTIELPAGALADALPGRAPVALGGTVTLAAGAFAWDGQRGSGALNARWRDARLVAAGTGASLGTVDAAFVPQDGGLRGRVTNSGGDVRIDGTVTLAATGGTADVLVAPLPGAPDIVARALTALGTPDGSGAVRIAWRSGAR